jgi:hypothetical protein
MLENLKKTLNQDNVKYSLLALLIVQVIFVRHTPNKVLEVYSSLEMRIVMAILVAYLAYAVPLLAIVLTVMYVVVLRQYQLKGGEVEQVKQIKQINTKTGDPRKDGVKDTVADIESVVSQYIGHAKNTIKDVKDKLEKVYQEEKSKKNSIPPEERNHPADKTLTDSIQLESDEYRQLNIAQTNSINSKEEPMTAFKDSLDAQGINYIRGFDKKTYESSRF